MAKTKKYTYKVTLRKKGNEENVVTVEAATACIDARGNLYFTDSPATYSPSCVAAFCAGSWLSLTREKCDGDPTQ